MDFVLKEQNWGLCDVMDWFGVQSITLILFIDLFIIFLNAFFSFVPIKYGIVA